ncbi:MAG TPA: four helix bundle protein [Gemmatimonadaceae bacterium]|nr:four helix bundle protein [Gemmatimonadaceae bacterium]
MALIYPRPLGPRLRALGVSILSAARSMPRDAAGRHIAEQIVRSGTSPAANYSEARGAVSDRDYLFRLQTCLKELRETETWLAMSRGVGFRNADYAAIEKECGELTAIVVTCVSKVKARLARSDEHSGPAEHK